LLIAVWPPAVHRRITKNLNFHGDLWIRPSGFVRANFSIEIGHVKAEL